MKLPSEFTVAVSLVMVIAALLAASLAGIAMSAWAQGEGATSILLWVGSGLFAYGGFRILLIALGWKL